jgi:ligand-binding SRPBCC domain-containing protein
MPTLIFQTTIAAPLSAVWAFHEDVRAALPALSPPGAGVSIESADLPVHVGSKIVIVGKSPVGKLRWVARIVEHVPPHAVAFGEEARFVDEQQSGPFARWRHSHEFERIDDRSTRLVDRVDYAVPWGPAGWVADWLFVRWQIIAMFRHRHAATKKLLEVRG